VQDSQVEIVSNLVDEPGHLASLIRVHACGRLVEQKQVRVAGQGPRDFQAPLVAIGEILRRVLALAAKTDVGHELTSARPCRSLFALDRREFQERTEWTRVQARMHADQHVLQRGHICEKSNVLECSRNTLAGDLIRTQAGTLENTRVGPLDRFTLEQDLALSQLVDTGDDIEKRRLAGAIRTNKSLDNAPRNLQIDAVDGGQSSESLGHASRLEHDRLRIHNRSCRNLKGVRAHARSPSTGSSCF
jgi:hypothetical protein